VVVTWRVRIDPLARRQISDFAEYLRDYSEQFAIEQIERLDSILRTNLGEAPLTWSYFPLTGAPYRAYLFRVGRRTQYWIIYTVDEDTRTVDVLQFWNAMRDPERLDFVKMSRNHAPRAQRACMLRSLTELARPPRQGPRITWR
jgi:mRNA-degrading endonuclease RelE of RelBE toxin-antitoxin system